MTQAEWNDADGAVFLAASLRRKARGWIKSPWREPVERRRGGSLALAALRHGSAYPHRYARPARRAWLALADLVRLPARSSLILSEAAKGTGAGAGAPTVEAVDKLAGAAGIAAEWSDIAGKRTIVSPETKVALLSGLGLEVASEAQARDSLTQLMDETQRRRLPFSLVLRADEPLAAPLRDMPGASDARIEREDGAVAEWSIEAADGVRRELADGRSVSERMVAMPTLPTGRHHLIVGGVECALTVAPLQAYSPGSASRKRFGAAVQLYALRRADESGRDQGIGDFSALAIAGEQAGQAGGAYLGVSPLHMLFPGTEAARAPITPRIAVSSIRS